MSSSLSVRTRHTDAIINNAQVTCSVSRLVLSGDSFVKLITLKVNNTKCMCVVRDVYVCGGRVSRDK